ncbi:MAG: ATP-binding cassette domain-containing protein [Synergistaceae bacterium]|jgi:molybdate transport system ATP-binding protein|nr:ATP-binding cassette domain-containing protein [Synergistaceae bacterium]
MSLYVDIRYRAGKFRLDAEFEAAPGVMGLLGASGCGKSMTLKCIAGVVRPDEGIISYGGRVFFDSRRKIDLPPQVRGVGLLFQNCALFPNMTLARNITAVLKARKDRDDAPSAASLVKKFHLEGLENHYPENMSGGQRQRAALACIMARGPSVLMLDEPLSALDSYLRWQLEGELSRVASEFGGVTLYVSHNRDEVYRMCSHVCVMNAGRTEPVRSIDDLFESPDTLASCLLSGCKNYSRAGISPRGIRALDWGAELECALRFGPETEYIGVRSHYVRKSDAKTGTNVFACRIERVTRDVFGTIVNVIPLGAPSDGDFSRIRMEMPREEAADLRAGDEIYVRIKPEDVMPLKS